MDYAFLLAFLYICPLQIFLARHPIYGSEERNEQLKEILATDRGKQIFELFLATDLSVENILFYNAVIQWKSEYREGSEVTRKQAKRIVTKYMQANSYLEINCSARSKQRVLQALEDDNETIPITLFDEVQKEIFGLMVGDF